MFSAEEMMEALTNGVYPEIVERGFPQLLPIEKVLIILHLNGYQVHEESLFLSLKHLLTIINKGD